MRRSQYRHAMGDGPLRVLPARTVARSFHPSRGDPMDSVIPVIGSVLVSTAAAIGTFLFARRLGLTAVQRSYAEESARLSATLKTRVDVLEAENARLKTELARVEAENADLRRRIIVLEHEFAEMKVNEMKAAR